MVFPGNSKDYSMYSESCSRWAEYPTNLVHRPEFEHELDSYVAAIKDPKTILFDPNSRARQLHMWDLKDHEVSQGHVLSNNLSTCASIAQIWDTENCCPIERYIFVQSASSRAALACEKQQMLMILSRNQVMPSFLDIIFTFKARDSPHTRADFSYEICLGREQPKLSLPSMAASGLRIQHCFNLIGLETDETKTDPWLIRQTAAYHSFDVFYHRTTWIVLKANKLIRERLQSATKSHRERFPDYTRTAQGCFLANLRSHILIYQWSAENWDSYIEFLESQLNKSKTIVNYSPIQKILADEVIDRGLKKNDTWKTLSSRQNIGFSALVSVPIAPTGSRRWCGLSKSNSGLNNQFARGQSPAMISSKIGQGARDRNADDLDLDKMFSFTELQSLHRLGSRIQEAINILGQNKRLIKDMKQYLQGLIASKEFSEFVDLEAHVEDVSGVFRRVDKVIRDMENYQVRLKHLLQELEKTTAAFNDTMQYRNMRLGEFLSKQGQMLAMQAKISTDSMNMISLKSRREAVSMHVITIWTLVFLPGTFVATFFSSGILDFTTVSNFGEWTISWVGLELFFIICCPIMLLTLAGWAYFWYQARETKASDNYQFSDVEKGNPAPKIESE